jgi:hypothetical protein
MCSKLLENISRLASIDKNFQNSLYMIANVVEEMSKRIYYEKNYH